MKRVAGGATLFELSDKGGAGVLDRKLSGDGRLLVASYDDDAIRVWQVADGKRLAKIAVPVTANGVAVAAVGAWIAAACEDRLVRVWRLTLAPATSTPHIA